MFKKFWFSETNHFHLTAVENFLKVILKLLDNLDTII